MERSERVYRSYASLRGEAPELIAALTGAVAAVEGALAGLAARGVGTADVGGSAWTGEVVAGVLEGLGVPGPGAGADALGA
ncbi:hypothetical protein ACFZC3_22935 [Streptomyces sp. NPDC007903]|uniref:hypothetical protein n=1 Tax=Streptomyces sp. NPDC007903 TaxID=3364786 RepID=UPI0036E07D33